MVGCFWEAVTAYAGKSVDLKLLGKTDFLSAYLPARIKMSSADERRQAQIDLFESAQRLDFSACEQALAAGADLNYNRCFGGAAAMGWRGWRLKMGGIEWGFQEWEAPNDVRPASGDTIAMIGIKCGLESLVRWAVERKEYNPNTRNKENQTAEDIARELNRLPLMSDSYALPEETNAPTLPGAPLRVKIERTMIDRSSSINSDYFLKHSRSLSADTPIDIIEINSILMEKNNRIEALKSSLREANIENQKLKNEVSDLCMKIKVLESSLKPVRPNWMR